MSINYVQITPAEEQYAPPTEIIELAVVADDTDQLMHHESDEGKTYYNVRYARKLVYLSLSDYKETDKGGTTKRKIEFPGIDLNDLLRALASFGVGVQAWHVGDPPTQLPSPPQEPSDSR